MRRNPKETARTKTARAGFHEGWGREEVLGVWISEVFPKNLVAVCHNSQSAALLSDSGLVMYFSTLPAPSFSAPCILAILTYLQGGVSKMCIMTQRLVFSVGDEVVARHLLRLRQSHDVENGGCHVGEDAVLHLGVFVCGDVDEGHGVE